MNKPKREGLISGVIGSIFTIFLFIVPFYFMFVNSIKSSAEANKLSIDWPSELHFENYIQVLVKNNFQLLTAFKNSTILTICSVIGLIICSSMAGYVIQRRHDKPTRAIQWLIMLGLMIPAAILPTISLLQKMHLYKTMFGMVMIEIALQLPFTIMLYRGYMASIPIELEEAACIDGCSNTRIFFDIILPLLKPIHATVLILDAVTIFNDFTNPLYFLPGAKNATVQLTLYNYKGQFSSDYNLLFADVILITLPMLVLFLLFNKKIVAGMVAGSVKG